MHGENVNLALLAVINVQVLQLSIQFEIIFQFSKDSLHYSFKTFTIGCISHLFFCYKKW